jgi:hypothetical protein
LRCAAGAIALVASSTPALAGAASGPIAIATAEASALASRSNDAGAERDRFRAGLLDNDKERFATKRICANSAYACLVHAATSHFMPKGIAPGLVTARFHLDSSGHVDEVKILRASSREHAEWVRKALGRMGLPPPPGGGATLTQNFRFD